ncbi:hypothetical protein PSP6_350024 [Paraburkholderia tropica]|nr:hypothetical protein PSP6_350024 [Paraburkholderia tropica]
MPRARWSMTRRTERARLASGTPAAPALTKKRVAPAQDVCRAVAYTATDITDIQPVGPGPIASGSYPKRICGGTSLNRDADSRP